MCVCCSRGSLSTASADACRLEFASVGVRLGGFCYNSIHPGERMGSELWLWTFQLCSSVTNDNVCSPARAVVESCSTYEQIAVSAESHSLLGRPPTLRPLSLNVASTAGCYCQRLSYHLLRRVGKALRLVLLLLLTLGPGWGPGLVTFRDCLICHATCATRGGTVKVWQCHFCGTGISQALR